MREGGEAREAATQTGRCRAREPRGERRGERVHDVVPSEQPKLVARDKGLVGSVRIPRRACAEREDPVTDERREARPRREGLGISGLAGEEMKLPDGVPGKRESLRVLPVHDPPARRRRIAEEPLLVREVAGHLPVAVQMVLREVRQDADLGGEPLDAGELERAQLENPPLGAGGSERERGGRRCDPPADVAPDGRVDPRGAEQVANQHRGRRLPIRSGHADQRTVPETRGELGLGDPAHTPGTQAAQDGSVSWNPRRGDDDPGTGNPPEVVAAQVDVRAERFKCMGAAPRPAIVRVIGDVNAAVLLQGEPGRGITARTEAEDRDPGRDVPDGRPGGPYRRTLHRTFRVLSATSAERTPRIQNRTTTCDSAHPAFSKW